MKAVAGTLILAFVVWASWPSFDEFPERPPEDAEALRLIRDLENERPGAWEAIVRARNPRTAPFLLLYEKQDLFDALLHTEDRRAICCAYGGTPHEPIDAFDSALQAAFLIPLESGGLKRRGCVRMFCAARAALEAKLDDPEPGVRYAAAIQLWRSGDLPSVPRVRGMLGEHALARHPWLASVLDFFREERSEEWIRAVARSGHGRGLAAAAFLKLRPAVDDIVPLLNDPERRADAAWALGEIGDRRAVGPLIQSLGRGDGWLTGDAAEALRKIGDRSALPALREALDGAGVYGQAEILRALGQLGGPEDIPLVERYATTDEHTGAIGRRRVARDALEKLRP